MPISTAAGRALREAARRDRQAVRAHTAAQQAATTHQVLRATKPLVTPQGVCLALRLSTHPDLETTVAVLVQPTPHSARLWRAVDGVLSPAQQALWARTGFEGARPYPRSGRGPDTEESSG